MTNVVIYKHDGNIIGFSCKGHTGYAEFGEDIVCASLSSIVQNCGIGLIKILGLNCTLSRDDKEGYYEIRLPEDIGEDNLEKSQILFETMYLSIKELKKGYPSNIKVEVKRL